MPRASKNETRPIYIGTSGYSYKHWAKGVFYPEGLSQRRWLEYYAEHFQTIELNVTFYRQPKPSVFQGWAQRTPVDFLFTLKGSRFITHIKRLRECEEPLERFFEGAQGLGEKLRLVLWQLPPSFKRDDSALEGFCKLLAQIFPNKVGQVFEFRNKSWFCQQIYNLIEGFGFHICVADSPRFPIEEKVLSGVGYIRFHGTEAMYGYNYSEKQLISWADKVFQWTKEASEIFLYFNNDIGGYAPRNASTLKMLLTLKAS